MKTLTIITGKRRGEQVTIEVIRKGERRQFTQPPFFGERRRGQDRRAPVWVDSERRSVNP